MFTIASLSLRGLAVLLVGAIVPLASAAERVTAEDAGNGREVVGTRTSENIPPLPATLGATHGTKHAWCFRRRWTREGCLLIGTRFAETNQAHRVCQPMGMREQLTFYPEPVASLTPVPATVPRDGFVFSRDVGGDEFSQLYRFDFTSRETTLLTDGKRSQNHAPVFSADGRWLAYSSTARNGKDTDVWVRDMQAGSAKAVVSEGGYWSALDFSPDGKRLLVIQYVSINESYPGEVDLASGKLTLFPVDGGKAAFGGFQFAADGKAVYFVSDEPFRRKPSKFQTLRYHDPASEIRAARVNPTGRRCVRVAADGRHWPSHNETESRAACAGLPGIANRLPKCRRLVGALSFSPDGKRLALTLNTATSPSDAYVLDLATATLTRWTQSEVGGLDTTKFVSPSLIRYPTFDKVKGKPRSIPAFYYRPASLPRDGKLPVVINIHGGPESQAMAYFSATTQYMVNELGVAVIYPNVRGSAGYGQSYLRLDNAEKREDSVRDIGALLDWIATQPELDPSRVAVMGGSYGGYMVLATMTRYPARIRAGIDVVGISHFGTFLKNTEDYRRDLRRAEYGDERDAKMQKVFERISPLNNAGSIRAPLFVAQGRNDPRVPYTEAEQIVKAVRANGQPVWYLLFSDEGHGFRKKSNSDYFNAASMLFLERHLTGK